MRVKDGIVVGLTVIGFIAAVVLVTVTLVTVLSRIQGRTICSNWGKQTNTPTKFVALNFSDTGTCLAKTPRGRWVKNSNWQAFINAGR